MSEQPMPARKRILLIGRSGQLGWELTRTLSTFGEVITRDRDDSADSVDLADVDCIRRAVRAVKPDLIVNAAAYTAVDRAEQEESLAMAINAIAPGVLAEEAAALGVPIVHYSTEYVFDGTKSAPYTEDDAPAPLSVYGVSKLAGERAVQSSGAQHLILRTSWVYGLRGHNFLLTMLRLARERDELRIVADQIGAPNWCRTLAQATAHVLAVLDARIAHGQGDAWQRAGGLYHFSAHGHTSWHGFTEAILNTRWPTGTPCKLSAITTADYPTPAKRPQNSRLSVVRLESEFGLSMPDWREQLALCLNELPQPDQSATV